MCQLYFIIVTSMVITSLQEKQNRKFYVPIRPGNRGGWSLFQWQSVREKPYRDRQMYLGNSAVIGVLDRGGKWRKRDWYLKTDKKYNDPNLKSEQEEAIRRDMDRMNSALGFGDAEQDDQKLNQQQMRELLKKIKNKDAQVPSGAVGLGFDKSRVQIRAKPNAKASNTTRLQGCDEIGDGHKKTEIKKNSEQSQSPQRSRQRRRQKTDKKNRKQKRSKRQRTPSSESSRPRDKQRRKKHKRDYSNSSSKSSERNKSRKGHRRHDSSSEDQRPRRRDRSYDRRYKN